MLTRVAVFLAAFSVGQRMPFWMAACGGVLLWCLRNVISKALEQPEGRYKMRFVSEQQFTALQSENEALRNACDSATARLVYANNQISILEQHLRSAVARTTMAETDLQEARKKVGARVLTDQEKLYARLGLTPSVPNAFLPHIRRAVLMTLHPDRHPPARRAAAEKRFVDAMSVIEQIEQTRRA